MKSYIKYFLLLSIFVINIKCYSQNEVRIACVGNSITYGATIKNREVNCYPAQLSAMLGDKYIVKNFGVSGTTLLRKGDYPYWETEQYKQALEFNPDIVFIKLGTNDTKPQNRIYLDSDYLNDYSDLIDSFRELSSNPGIVLVVPIPVFSEDQWGICSSVLNEKIIPKVRQLAYEKGCDVINLYNLLLDKSELVPDHVHPNAEGAEIIARRFYDYVRMKADPSFDILKALPVDNKPFNFYGFQGYDFTFQGRKAKVVEPKHSAPDHPWVWRARFWGHEPQTDIALLERGFHIVYCDVAELYGNDLALSIWDSFYKLLTEAGLSKKSVMEGMSRGGFYIYRWAAKYPERIAAIYADAPVLDLKSWPGGQGKGSGSPNDWERFKNDFGFVSDEEALSFRGNPLDLANEIAKAGFPMLHVVGDADKVVPVSENTELFEQKIKEAGGSIKVIHKPGVGHHPHSLPNPQQIVDFVLIATDYQAKQDLLSLSSEPQLRWQNYECLVFVQFAPNTRAGLGKDDNLLPMERLNFAKLNTV